MNDKNQDLQQELCQWVVQRKSSRPFDGKVFSNKSFLICSKCLT